MFRAILYISDLTSSIKRSDASQTELINDISSKINNNISGVLAYNNNHFLHVLEGKKNSIDEFLQNVENDERNKNISVILDINTDKKIYDNWEIIDSRSAEQSKLMSYFLQRCIDHLPMIEQAQHDILEDFVNDIFY